MRTYLVALCVMVAATGALRAQEYIIPPLEKDAVKDEFQKRGDERVRILTVRFKILRKADNEAATEVEESWIRVYEDDKPVKQVKLIRKPIARGFNVVLVLDVSDSMKAKASDADDKSKIEALHDAATAFIKRLPPKSRVTLLPFSDTVDVPVPFTDNKSRLEAAIRALQPRGGTLLYDAIYSGVETLVADRHPGRQAVIVLTDGKDEVPGSRHTPSEVIEVARDSKVPLYLLGLGREFEINESIMRDLARETNGSYKRAQDQKQLIQLFSDLATGFQDEDFEIEFASLQQRQDGTARSIRIEVWREVRVLNSVTGKQEVVSINASGEGVKTTYATRGMALPELDAWVYFPLLGVLIGLLALPYGLARLAKAAVSVQQ